MAQLKEAAPVTPVKSDRTGAAAAMYWATVCKVSDALLALSETGVLDMLDREAQTAADLAARAGLQQAFLVRLLDLLARAALLEREGPAWRLSDGVGTMLAFLRLEARLRRRHVSNDSLVKALRTGRGFDPMDEADDNLRGDFFTAMSSATRSVAAHMVRAARFRPGTKFVDLGGADGSLAMRIAALVPGSRFTVVDRRASQPFFNRATIGMSDRFTFVPADLSAPCDFKDILSDANTVILSNLLHLLNAGRRRELLTQILKAGAIGSGVVVYDQFLSASVDLDAAHFMVVDWVNCGVAFDLTPEQLADELREIGYANTACCRFDTLSGAFVSASIP